MVLEANILGDTTQEGNSRTAFDTLCQAAQNASERYGKNNARECQTQSYGLMDISEEEDVFMIYIDAPGVNKEDIEILVENNCMTVKAVRRPEEETSVYYSERSQLAIVRKILLPSGTDCNKISSSYINGVITIKIMKDSTDRNKIIKKIPVE